MVDRPGGPRLELQDAPVGVALRPEPAELSAPLLEATEPWETNDATGSVSPLLVWRADSAGHLQMLYDTPAGTCLAVSSDGGRQWERPALNERDFEGSTANNLIAHGIKGATGVFIDENPECPPSQRFKAIGGDMAYYDPDTCQPLDKGEPDKRQQAIDAWPEAAGLYQGPKAVLWGRTLGWTSPDGLDWTPTPQPLASRAVNGGICAKFDVSSGQYIGYMQVMGDKSEAEFPKVGSGEVEQETQRRTVAFSHTKNFVSWPAPKLILAPDGQDGLDTCFYGANCAFLYTIQDSSIENEDSSPEKDDSGATDFSYPGRSDIHCMVLPLFHRSTNVIDSQLSFSRDGLIWDRPERRACVVPLGGGEMVSVHPWRSGLIELEDSWAVPHTCASELHATNPSLYTGPQRLPGQIRFAHWQPHRLCGVTTTDTEGGFTIPSMFRGASNLRLNYRCEPGGWIQVGLLQKNPAQLQSPTADPVEQMPGFEVEACDLLRGDETDAIVTWGGGERSDITALGESLVIRVRMSRAKLFAYMV